MLHRKSRTPREYALEEDSQNIRDSFKVNFKMTQQMHANKILPAFSAA